MPKIITSKDYKGVVRTLTNKHTDQPVTEGTELKDFRGDPVVITGGSAPHKPGATGYAQDGHGHLIYASVVDCYWK
jgi:hypothetical protein